MAWGRFRRRDKKPEFVILEKKATYRFEGKAQSRSLLERNPKANGLVKKAPYIREHADSLSTTMAADTVDRTSPTDGAVAEANILPGAHRLMLLLCNFDEGTADTSETKA